MHQQGKIREVDFEAAALSLIALNFGHFMSRARLGTIVSDLPTEELLQTSVAIFLGDLFPRKIFLINASKYLLNIRGIKMTGLQALLRVRETYIGIVATIAFQLIFLRSG